MHGYLRLQVPLVGAYLPLAPCRPSDHFLPYQPESIAENDMPRSRIISLVTLLVSYLPGPIRTTVTLSIRIHF